MNQTVPKKADQGQICFTILCEYEGYKKRLLNMTLLQWH